jgi:hypothetical protein
MAPDLNRRVAHANLAWLVLSLLGVALGACSSRSSRDPGAGGGSGTGHPGEVTCRNSSGEQTDECPIDVDESICSSGDANSCVATDLLEVTETEDGGACVHLVLGNGCGVEVYSYTCIATNSDAGWQCWSSSTLPGDEVDVSVCQATGEVRHFSTKSHGEVTVLKETCDAPLR